MLSILSKKPPIVVALLLACTSVVIVVSSPKFRLRSTSHPPTPRLRNNTKSVQISSLQQLSNGDVEITFVNKSSKTIYGYTILTVANQIQKGLTTFATVEPIDPSGIKVERIPAGNLEFTSSIDSIELIFSAAYFEGGTAEGDARESEKLSRTMRGMKEQAQNALNTLNDAIQSSELDDNRLIEAIEAKSSSIDANQAMTPPSHETHLGREMVTERLNGELLTVRLVKRDPQHTVRDKLRQLG